MRVTIIADASYCPDTKVAGYGFWIASQRGKNGGNGPMKGLCETNTVAEMQAVVNALYTGLKGGYVHEGDIVLLQTDCEAALQAFDGTRKKLCDQEHESKIYLHQLRERFQLTFEFRHVKGHSKGKEARFASANACDRLARKAMRKARNLFRIQLIKESLK